jgi:hypothetical protein
MVDPRAGLDVVTKGKNTDLLEIESQSSSQVTVVTDKVLHLQDKISIWQWSWTRNNFMGDITLHWRNYMLKTENDWKLFGEWEEFMIANQGHYQNS